MTKKTILVDFSAIGHKASAMVIKDKSEVDVEDILKPIHKLLIRSINIAGDIEEIILAIDSSSNWRYTYFPNYKAKRTKTRKESNFDWKSYYKAIDTIVEEYKTNSTMKVIKVDKAEADDVIAVLTKYKLHNNTDKTVSIISSDKDYFQLYHRYPNQVTQFSPASSSWINYEEENLSIVEHILRGDYADGIPNILTDDDVYIKEGKKSKALASTNPKVKAWLNMSYSELMNHFLKTNLEEESIRNNFKRNVRLIDMNAIPKTIQDSIIETYQRTETGDSRLYRKWLFNNKLL